MNYVEAPKLPENARVVCFHGRPKMPEAVAGYRGSWLRWSRPCGWLKDHWIDRAARTLVRTGPDPGPWFQLLPRFG